MDETSNYPVTGEEEESQRDEAFTGLPAGPRCRHSAAPVSPATFQDSTHRQLLLFNTGVRSGLKIMAATQRIQVGKVSSSRNRSLRRKVFLGINRRVLLKCHNWKFLLDLESSSNKNTHSAEQLLNGPWGAFNHVPSPSSATGAPFKIKFITRPHQHLLTTSTIRMSETQTETQSVCSKHLIQYKCK